MKKRLFFLSAIIIFVGLISFFAVSVYITYDNNLSLAKDTVIEKTQILASLYNAGTDVSAFVQAGGETRITVVAADGTILADNRPLDAEAVLNRLDRPEIQAAASGSPETFVRYSETLGANNIYYALKVNAGGSYVFIRASIPVAKIDAYLFGSLPILIIFLLITTILCFILIQGVTKQIVTPFTNVERKLKLLSSGNYEPEQDIKSYEEIEAIIKGIDEVALILGSSFDNLRSEKSKLDYILNNIRDGLFAVNESKDVELINAAALDIFDVTPDIDGKNLNYLTYNNALADAVEDCVSQEKNTAFDFTLQGKIYFTMVKRLPNSGLTMVVLTDITENRENAKRREEFFANASHELKTPLTAIKGFNELTLINNKDENISKYVDGITRETNRMLSLINDMLKLSELENTQNMDFDFKAIPEIKFSDIIKDAQETVSALIHEKSITFESYGDTIVKALPEHAYELVKNLIENAVRYNNNGGRVDITIEKLKKTTRLTVSDNGIGISPEEQIRIFERFYRVEKSRSGRGGGTGLGLSIVKHICALYDWKLSLKSKLGLGTEITVIFNS